MVPNSLPKGRRQRLIFGFGALLILAALFAAIVGNAMGAAAARSQAQGWYVHTLEVLITTEALKGAANTAIRGERGYLITANPQFLQRSYRTGREESARLVEALGAQTRDNPAQRQNLVELRKRISSFFAVLDRATGLRRAGQEAAATSTRRSPRWA
jgi:CHASE3 domain sensor protein